MSRFRFLGLTPVLLVALAACGSEPTTLAPSAAKATNTAPTITTFTASKTSGSAPLTTTFTVQASDRERDALTCVLDVNGDGYGDLNFGDCKTSRTQTYSFTTAGTTNVKLLVTDSKGASTSRVLTITVTDPVPPPPTPSGNAWVMGYYVGYLRDAYPLDAVNWTAMTHIVVGRATPNADGTINTHFDIDTVNGPIWAKSVVSRAHANNRKAILMLGGAGEYSGFVGAASDANRAKFIDNLLALVDSYGFDGIDLDWEPIQATDQAPLKALAAGLKAKRPGLILTLPIGWVNSTYPQWNATPYYADIAPLFDRLNIMSYAMNGVYDGWQSWHSSALSGHSATTPSSVESSVNAYLNVGVPAAKLGVGIGFFGSCYTGVTGPKQSSSIMKLVADDNVMSYTNIMTQYYNANVKLWDDGAKVPYLSSQTGLGPKACNFVSYEDPQSIALKGQFAQSKGLGGAIVWNINQGYLPNAPIGSRDPLMDAVRSAFLP
ncbi:glycosyl hydrolase family 18 protein [Deinococcus yavapaiensis]|uniref:chitinase n=1 Tax=Deinococcus yavapaiensis KR-236 TaxID=694435 RepID=A0A318SDH7_9DEIO|nr:glycosyl hydrolase family 18 protein [Deinococcus yavapaiensis]PYE55424.1 chitinase [Deinococcus yavapaiensis KR-236]